MKVELVPREGLFKELRVEVEGAIVDNALKEVYQYLMENAEVEGFRRGKAPLWIIKARFKETIKEETGKKVADATLHEAIKMANVEPVADIYLEDIQLDEGSLKLSYKVSFETQPEFELKDLSNLEVTIKPIKLNDEMLRKAIEELREEHAVWEPVDREIREGDLVVLDYEIEELSSGEVIKDETSAIVGQGMLRQEIEKELIGKKEGDELVFEELDLYSTEGKPVGKAKVKLVVKAVKEKKLPELNDEFAKEAGLGETWEEAQEKIRRSLEERIESLRKQAISEALVQKLVQMHDFEVPKTLLSRELSFLVARRLETLKQLGVDPRYVDIRLLSQELLPLAVQNIKLRYILEKYSQEKGFEVSQEELEKYYEELASSYNTSKEEFKEYVKERGLEEQIRKDLIRQKAFEDLLSKVKVTEEEENKDEGQSS